MCSWVSTFEHCKKLTRFTFGRSTIWERKEAQTLLLLANGNQFYCLLHRARRYDRCANWCCLNIIIQLLRSHCCITKIKYVLRCPHISSFKTFQLMHAIQIIYYILSQIKGTYYVHFIEFSRMYEYILLHRVWS